jgi:hypothetical protein
MIPKEKELKLIQIYMYICDLYDQERQHRKAYNDLFSAAVSKVRQPIESFFNRMNEKTTIQRAQKGRFTKGLHLHTMGKIAIVFHLSRFLNTDSHNS